MHVQARWATNRHVPVAQQEMWILSTKPPILSRTVIQQTSSSSIKYNTINVTFSTTYFLHPRLPHSATISGDDHTLSCFRNTVDTHSNFIARILYKNIYWRYYETIYTYTESSTNCHYIASFITVVTILRSVKHGHSTNMLCYVVTFLNESYHSYSLPGLRDVDDIVKVIGLKVRVTGHTAWWFAVEDHLVQFSLIVFLYFCHAEVIFSFTTVRSCYYLGSINIISHCKFEELIAVMFVKVFWLIHACGAKCIPVHVPAMVCFL